jgi:phosphoserine aminotransferase
VAALDLRALGRSHRSALGKELLERACSETHRLLGLPADYRVGIVPASDTGAIEMALWSLLGARGVDVLGWETFGLTWVSDIVNQLKLPDVRVFKAGYGALPDLAQVDCSRDVVFAWNGTTSGVRVPDADWLAADRQGLTICDATSAAFSMDLPWHKLDVATFSWQKALGGEGAHGMLVLSPRAVQRLESHVPPWPLPKIFRLTKKDAAGAPKLLEGVFHGETINTPSMLCVADYLGALAWADAQGGVPGLVARSQASLKVIEDFAATHPWLHFLAQDAATRSCTSVCLTLDATPEQVKALARLLEAEGVAFDINAYKDAPPGLRIWCGATVEPGDVRALMPWIEWAYAQVTA